MDITYQDLMISQLNWNYEALSIGFLFSDQNHLQVSMDTNDFFYQFNFVTLVFAMFEHPLISLVAIHSCMTSDLYTIPTTYLLSSI